MNYKETIEWMFGHLPMFQQKGASAYKPKLDNIIKFADYLGHPERSYKSVHIAGTNGKGSSSHSIASVLMCAGYKVGLYTSPHLRDFRERIRVNGEEVSEEFVVRFIEGNKKFLEENELSFFEMTVGMAFEYFREMRVDVAVVEVGLGGRFDSTNIIEPEVSLITNIGLDHTEILGDTIGKIAYQKAGIIKKGVPVVISEYDPESAEVFRKVAEEQGSKIIFANDMEVDYEMDLKGDYQKKNIKGIVATLEVLKERGFKIEDEHIKIGLMQVAKSTRLMGRWQTISENPKIICDTGHNKHGLEWVMKQLARQEKEKLHIVLGFVREKDVDSILPMFPKDAIYYFCRPNIPRGMDVDILVEKAKNVGLMGEKYGSVGEALEVAKVNCGEKDVIFVGGSTFVVAEVV